MHLIKTCNWRQIDLGMNSLEDYILHVSICKDVGHFLLVYCTLWEMNHWLGISKHAHRVAMFLHSMLKYAFANGLLRMFFPQSEYYNSLTWGIYTFNSVRNANIFQVKESLVRVYVWYWHTVTDCDIICIPYNIIAIVKGQIRVFSCIFTWL